MEMSVESATMRYGDLNGNIQLVELQKGQTGLGLSLAGNRDRNKMSVFVCGLHPKGSAYRDGRIRGMTSFAAAVHTDACSLLISQLLCAVFSFSQSEKVGDEILEVNGYALFGRCHLNASAVIKSLDGPVYRILLLRRESALNEMAVKPLTQFPVHLEEEALEEKYNRFTGVRTVTVRKSPLGLGIMIIEGKHTDLGRGVFISDIQSGSPAEQSGLAVGDMILCVNQTDLICSDYDTAASLLKNAEGLLSIVVAKPNKTCLKTSLSHGPDNSLRRLSSPSNNCSPNNNNLKMEGGVTAPSSQSCKQKSESRPVWMVMRFACPLIPFCSDAVHTPLSFLCVPEDDVHYEKHSRVHPPSLNVLTTSQHTRTKTCSKERLCFRKSIFRIPVLSCQMHSPSAWRWPVAWS